MDFISCVVVMPTYNEAECIKTVILSWTLKLKSLFGASFRLLVVNDGSKDATPQYLDQLTKEIPELIVIHQKNGGHGNALLAGYRRALELKPEFVFHVDSDNQFIPDDFDTLEISIRFSFYFRMESGKKRQF